MISLLIIFLAFALLGFIMVAVAFTKRTVKHPWYSNCAPVRFWKRREWYTHRGYVMHVTGLMLFYTGLLLAAVYFFLRM